MAVAPSPPTKPSSGSTPRAASSRSRPSRASPQTAPAEPSRGLPRPSRAPATPPAKPAPKADAAARRPRHRPTPSPPPLADLDRRKARQIASGKIEIEARIDLHGLRQRDAHARLRGFLLDAHARGFKTVLVITGKGGEAPSRSWPAIWRASAARRASPQRAALAGGARPARHRARLHPGRRPPWRRRRALRAAAQGRPVGLINIAGRDTHDPRRLLSGSGSFSTMSAAFSPIMIDGALVLPDVSVGMIEASATRRPVDAMDAELGIDDSHRVRAHLAGPDRVVGGLCRLLDPVQDFVVGGPSRRRARSPLTCKSAMAGAVMMERAMRTARTVSSRVDRRRQEIEVDRRRSARIGRGDVDVSLALRPHRVRVARHARLAAISSGLLGLARSAWAPSPAAGPAPPGPRASGRRRGAAPPRSPACLCRTAQ